jgi:hypothetical protein
VKKVRPVRVYLVGYIIIIDCHIYQDIFARIDIRLPYVSRGVFPLKTIVLYIYWPRGTKSTIIHNLFFLHGNQSLVFFFNPRSLRLPSSAPPPERSISTPPGAAPLVRRPILLIQSPLHRVKPSADQSSPSDRHRHWPPTQLHSHHHRRPRHRRVVLGCLSRIGQPPLRQIHAAAPITPPPPPKLQSIASTTATSLLFERMRDQWLWACAWLST